MLKRLAVLALLAGCTNDERVAATIGAEGGSLTLGALTLTIPAGALDAPTPIRIESSTRAPSGFHTESPLYHLYPSGLRFKRRAVASYRIASTDPAARLWLSNSRGGFSRLPTRRKGDVVRAPVAHFSDLMLASHEVEACSGGQDGLSASEAFKTDRLGLKSQYRSAELLAINPGDEAIFTTGTGSDPVQIVALDGTATPMVVNVEVDGGAQAATAVDFDWDDDGDLVVVTAMSPPELVLLANDGDQFHEQARVALSNTAPVKDVVVADTETGCNLFAVPEVPDGSTMALLDSIALARDGAMVASGLDLSGVPFGPRGRVAAHDSDGDFVDELLVFSGGKGAQYTLSETWSLTAPLTYQPIPDPNAKEDVEIAFFDEVDNPKTILVDLGGMREVRDDRVISGVLNPKRPSAITTADVAGDGRQELLALMPDGQFGAFDSDLVPLHSLLQFRSSAEPPLAFFAQDTNGDGRADRIFSAETDGILGAALPCGLVGQAMPDAGAPDLSAADLGATDLSSPSSVDLLTSPGDLASDVTITSFGVASSTAQTGSTSPYSYRTVLFAWTTQGAFQCHLDATDGTSLSAPKSSAGFGLQVRGSVDVTLTCDGQLGGQAKQTLSFPSFAATTVLFAGTGPAGQYTSGNTDLSFAVFPRSATCTLDGNAVTLDGSGYYYAGSVAVPDTAQTVMHTVTCTSALGTDSVQFPVQALGASNQAALYYWWPAVRLMAGESVELRGMVTSGFGCVVDQSVGALSTTPVKVTPPAGATTYTATCTHTSSGTTTIYPLEITHP